MASKNPTKNYKESFTKARSRWLKFLKNKNTKKYLKIFQVVVVVLAVLYLARGLLVVSFVNGSPITRFELVRELEKLSGAQVLESLVTKRLISQQARQKGVVVSDEEIDSEIEEIAALIETQGTTLDEALAFQGQTREDLEENVRTQKTVEKIFEKEGELEVAEEEIKNFYEENKQFYKDDETFEDVREEIKNQLKQQKLSSAFQEWVLNLKSESSIINIVEY